MELTRVEIFKAMNSKDLKNLKACEGAKLLPVASHTHTYEDSEGKEHTVLVIKDGHSNEMYRTEVRAFIDKYMAYDEAFGSLPDTEKPEILITVSKSRKGYAYINFDVLDV